jgi:protein-disulfide isomerase
VPVRTGAELAPDWKGAGDDAASMTTQLFSDRRRIVAGLAAAAVLGASKGAAAPNSLELATEDGSPIRNFRAPDMNRLLALPGLMIVGADDADVTLAEFFDYNCGYCREAASGLDELLRSDRKLRIVIVHNPVLSPASAGAARAHAGVLMLYGAGQAYALHKRLLALPGRIDDGAALAVGGEMGLDRDRIARAMAEPAVAARLQRQMQFAADAGLRITPTFVMAGVGFVGWPGVATLSRFLAAARSCGALRCG